MKNEKNLLNDEELNEVVGGMTKEEVEAQLFKVGDLIDNQSGYFYKVVNILSIDYNNIDNSEYEIEVYFLRDKYEYNDTRKHKELSRYPKC